jgi:lipopolysaccharide transport system ATP-binding protein
MMKPVIRAEHLNKKYRLGAHKAAYSTLRELLTERVRSPLKRQQRAARESEQTLWALKDVNFEIRLGEVVGIVGRNGAGKSTLLKILSRVTEPTSGRVEIYGRLGSLLEVGTGFHPELTGRENVFLNGAILGMRKTEIKRKFDEIVAFSEIEKFIDTPVKFYSSGMYVRLAFSVAAHLEPDVLLIDEVLSVGDMAFQQKCIDKIGSMRKQTKAIILVSHSMISVRAICTRAILMKSGTLAASGDPKDIIPLYEKLMRASVGADKTGDEVEEGTGLVRINSVKMLDTEGGARQSFDIGEKVSVVVEYNAAERVEDVIAYAAIRRLDDFICVATSTQLENITLPPLEGPGTIEIEIPEMLVIPGHYIMDVVFYDRNIEYRSYFLGRKRIEFEVRPTLPYLDEFYGVFYQKQNWKIVAHREGAVK